MRDSLSPGQLPHLWRPRGSQSLPNVLRDQTASSSGGLRGEKHRDRHGGPLEGRAGRDGDVRLSHSDPDNWHLHTEQTTPIPRVLHRASLK